MTLLLIPVFLMGCGRPHYDITCYPGTPDLSNATEGDADTDADTDPDSGDDTAAETQDADSDGFDSNSDCNETDATINPGAPERMNLLDDNCNGTPDEGCSSGCAGDYVTLNLDGAACRDDQYALASSGDRTWECTGDVWYVVP